MKHRMGSHDLAGRVRVVEVLSSVKRALDLQGDSLFLYKKPADLPYVISREKKKGLKKKKKVEVFAHRIIICLH